MIKETSNQLKARARGTLLGHYGLPIGASILTTAAIMTLEGLISLVVPKNTAGILISYLTMLIAAIFSTLLQTGYQYLLLNMARGKKARAEGSHLSLPDNAGSCDPAGGKTVPFDPGLHASVFGRSHHLRTVLPASDFKDHYGSCSCS